MLSKKVISLVIVVVLNYETEQINSHLCLFLY